MDRQRFSYVAHGAMKAWNPIQSLRFDYFASMLTVPKDGTVLDIGCGRGYWLLQIAEFFDIKCAIGVEKSPYAANAAKQEAANSTLQSQVKIVHREFTPAAYGDESFDLVLCMGASHALSNYEGALREAYRLLRRNGQLLIGEGYWKREPDAEYLSFLNCDKDQYTTSEGNCRRATENGYKLQWHYECTEVEWNTYEDQYAQNVETYVASNPDDPDNVEMLSAIRSWRDHYLRFGYNTLGFGLYLFSKNS